MEKYNRVKKIGEGAFGKAILVKAKTNGSQHVIKEINIGRMSAREREEARKEVAVLAQLKHPNIVAYRESFEEGGSLYIVMNYCAGGDLYSRINNQRGILFREEQIWDWFVQMCLAIKHIHDRKILHRDIKSQNIFLAADGTVQIGDFGIAKVLNSTVELARTCIGTPYYLSPEIVENKPYNNKSDIWSLGCVLYEVTTLKHAFEAGNMKNLVLKIIRGVYPPIAPQYSYELRGLIAQLFKRAPRDRPSINSVLKKNFIIQRARKFLSDEQMQEEFSHTVKHGEKIARALPPPPRPGSAGPNKRPVSRPPSGKYNPAAVYGTPLVKKSKENRSSVEVRKKSASSGGRPIPGQQDWEKKRLDMMDREKRRRDEAKKKEQDMYARQHKDFIERQKNARINKAREEGWKSVVNSMNSDEGDKKPASNEREFNNIAPPKPVQANFGNKIPLKDRGNYNQYHAYLDKLQKDKQDRKFEDIPAPVKKNPGEYMAAPRAVPQVPQNRADRQYISKALNRPPSDHGAQVYSHAQQAEQNRKAAAEAAERAKIVEDFMQRKRDAAYNRQRGQADIYGYRAPGTPAPRPGQGGGARPLSAQGARNREEQEYLEKLRQIREQNMKERRMLQGKIKDDKKVVYDPKKEAEERKKKTDALRQQADEWSQKKKEQLEKDKKEIMDRMKAREEHMRAREIKAKDDRPVTPQKIDMKPVPAVPITGVLHAIGAGGESGAESDRPKSAVQQKKDDILKRLNEKGPSRGKWGAPASPMAVPEEEDEEVPSSSRSKWGDADKAELSELPLEQTASQMEATSARDQVVKAPTAGGATPQPQVTPRNQWGKPGGTVVGVLQGLPICDATMSIASNQSGSTDSNPTSPMPVVPSPAPGIGATITISKTPIRKGTITIKAADATAAAKGDEKFEEREDGIPGTLEEAALPAASQKPVAQHVIDGSVEPSANEKPEPILESDEEESLEEILQPEKDNQSKSSEPADSQSDLIKHDVVSCEIPDVKPSDEDIPGSPQITENPSVPVKPTVSNKPPVPQKPLLFPKPVLLPKPELPEELFVKGPDVVRSEGAGSLFEKVELEDEDVDEKKDEDKINLHVEEVKESGDADRFVKKGISTGQFDMRNVQLLRTVSEPDLTKLFKTAVPENPFVGVLSRHISMDILKEADDSPDVSCQSSRDDSSEPEEQSTPPKQEMTMAEDEENMGEDAEEDDDDDNDDDLLSVRATMQSLLLDGDEEDDDKKGGSEPIQFSLSSDRESESQDDAGAEDKDEEKETEDEQEEDVGLRNSESSEGASVGLAEPRSLEPDLFDDSDGETQFGDDDDDDEDFDLFSRLEQARVELEKALGFDKFIEVYKAVQALQEDEDENIEEGARIAMEMLGREKEHLYPRIFQLVIADTAFTEDNG